MILCFFAIGLFFLCSKAEIRQFSFYFTTNSAYLQNRTLFDDFFYYSNLSDLSASFEAKSSLCPIPDVQNAEFQIIFSEPHNILQNGTNNDSTLILNPFYLKSSCIKFSKLILRGELNQKGLLPKVILIESLILKSFDFVTIYNLSFSMPLFKTSSLCSVVRLPFLQISTNPNFNSLNFSIFDSFFETSNMFSFPNCQNSLPANVSYDKEFYYLMINVINAFVQIQNITITGKPGFSYTNTFPFFFFFSACFEFLLFDIFVTNSIFFAHEYFLTVSFDFQTNVFALLKNITLTNCSIKDDKLISDIVYSFLYFQMGTLYPPQITFQNFYFYNMSFLNNYIFKFAGASLRFFEVSNIRIENSLFNNSNFLEMVIDVPPINFKNFYVGFSSFIDSSLMFFTNATIVQNIVLLFNCFSFILSQPPNNFYFFAFGITNSTFSDCQIVLEGNMILSNLPRIYLIYLNQPPNENGLICQNLSFFFKNQTKINIFKISDSISSLTVKKCHFIDTTQIFSGYFFFIDKRLLSMNFNLTNSTFQGFAINFPLFYFQANCTFQIFLENLTFNDFSTFVSPYNMHQTAIIFVKSPLKSLISIAESKFTSFFFPSLWNISILRFDSPNSNLSIINSIFENYSSIGDGKNMIFANVEILLIKNCDFRNFNFQKDLFYFLDFSLVSMLQITASSVNISNSSFYYSKAAQGGVFYISVISAITFRINSCKFKENFAKLGAVFDIFQDQLYSISFILTECIFSTIYSIFSGGVFSFETISEVIIYKSSFLDCVSGIGGILSANASNVFLSECLIEISKNNSWNSFHEDGVFLDYLSKIGPAISIGLNTNLTTNSCSIMNLISSNGTVNIFHIYRSYYNDISSVIFQNEFVTGSLFFQDSIGKFWKTIFKSNIFVSNGIFVANDYNSFIYLIWGTIDFLECAIDDTQCVLCLNGGGFLRVEYGFVNISNCTFANNQAYYGSVLHSMKYTSNFLYHQNFISNCIFKNNSAIMDGGSLYFIETTFFLNKNIFEYGSAFNRTGGVLYFKGASTLNPLPIVSNCIFQHNFAVIGGAIYYLVNDLLLKENNNSFYNNTASANFGNNFFSYPRYLKINNLKIPSDDFMFDEKRLKIFYFRSGQNLNFLTVKLLSEENEIICPTKILGEQILTIKLFGMKSQQYIFSLNYDSFFNISKLSIFGKPKTNQILIFSSDSIFFPNKNQTFSSNYSLILNTTFRECKKNGELYLHLTDQSCFICLPGTYSYNPWNVICKSCPDGGDCSKSGIFLINPGFWRRNLYDESLNILSCENNELNCVGGSNFGNDLCYRGHIGPRCEGCDLKGLFWGHSYSFGQNYGCIDCSQTNYTWLFVVFAFMFFTFFFSIILKENISNYEKATNNSSNSSRKHSFYLKIIISYFQIIITVEKFKMISTSTFEQIYMPMSSPLVSAFFSLECMIAALFKNSVIPILYWKLIISWVLPVIFALLAVVFCSITMRSKIRKHLNKILPHISLFTFMFFQEALVELSIQSLSCVIIGDNKYIKADVSLVCDEVYLFFSKTIGIPSLLLSFFIIPLFFFWQIFKNRKNLSNPDIKFRFGLLYNEYESRVFYWEFIKISEKLLISGIFEYYDSYTEIKGMLGFAVVFGYFLMLIHAKPFSINKDENSFFEVNFFEEMSSIDCFLSIYLCVFIVGDSYTFLKTLSSVILLIINLLMLGYISFLSGNIFWAQIKKFKEIIMSNKNKNRKNNSVISVKSNENSEINNNIYNENKNEQSTMRRLRNNVDHFEEIEMEENAKNFINFDCEMMGKLNQRFES